MPRASGGPAETPREPAVRLRVGVGRATLAPEEVRRLGQASTATLRLTALGCSRRSRRLALRLMLKWDPLSDVFDMARTFPTEGELDRSLRRAKLKIELLVQRNNGTAPEVCVAERLFPLAEIQRDSSERTPHTYTLAAGIHLQLALSCTTLTPSAEARPNTRPRPKTAPAATSTPRRAVSFHPPAPPSEPRLRAQERGQAPSRERMRACTSCRGRAHDAAQCPAKAPSAAAAASRVSRSSASRPLEDYDHNSYYKLRMASANRRPRPKTVEPEAGSGDAYLQMQRKLAGLMHLCHKYSDETEERRRSDPPARASVPPSRRPSQHQLEPSGDASPAAGRLVGTSELLQRGRGKPLEQESTERLRWFEDVLQKQPPIQVPLDEDHWWSSRAGQLQGGKTHREVFQDSLSTIYSRLYRSHADSVGDPAAPLIPPSW